MSWIGGGLTIKIIAKQLDFGEILGVHEVLIS